MKGSEKQIAWAEQIIEDALSTCKTNIQTWTDRGDANMARKFQIAIDMLTKGFATPEAQSASWIIDNRANFDGKRICWLVDNKIK